MKIAEIHKFRNCLALCDIFEHLHTQRCEYEEYNEYQSNNIDKLRQGIDKGLH